MAKQILDIRKEIRKAKSDLNLARKTDCTEEENKKYLQMLQEGKTLPDGVYRYINIDETELDEFYVIHESQYTEKEQREYLVLMQYKELKTIRKCAVVLTVLASIAFAIGLWIIFCNA